MRLAVISDIHGNLLALETVLEDIATRAPDVIVNLGDCVTSPLWPRFGAPPNDSFPDGFAQQPVA